MKTAAFACRLSLSLLLLSAAGAAQATISHDALIHHAVVDNPAQHPTFTVRVVGKGQPMLLIPGLTCPGAVWDEAVAHYQKQYQCHIITLAGFGGTAPAATLAEPLLPAVRDQLLAYIKTQKLNKPVVMGHSLGGFMALALSTAQPDAIGPLVIVDSLPFLAAVQNPDATVETVRPMAEQARQRMKNGQPLAARRPMVAGMVTDTARQTQVARWGVASDAPTVAQAMYDMYTIDLRDDISRIKQPVLVLGAWAPYAQYGSTKESTRAIFAQQYAKLPQVRIELSEAGRHFLMYDDTAWFLAQSDAFLKQPAVAKK